MAGHRTYSLPNPVVIADFENLTEEPLSDRSLDTALRVSIEQSSYVNVFPRRRITDTVRRMKKDKTQRITAAVGREIAEREGIKVLLVPVISGAGGSYVLRRDKGKPGRALSDGQLLRGPGEGRTLDQLELAVSKGWSNHVWTKIHPDHENLALEPRFQALMARVLR